MDSKDTYRKLVRERRGQGAPSELLHDSYAIFRKIRAMDEYIAANTIYAYADFKNEVMTSRFIAQALGDGKLIALPRVENGEINFYLIESLRELSPNQMGIPEPGPDADPADSAAALMIMPGVAFDYNRNRIGYGGGYYDRYLKKNPYHKTIAVAFEFQLFDEIPHETYDVRPQILVTEGRILRDLHTKKGL